MNESDKPRPVKVEKQLTQDRKPDCNHGTYLLTLSGSFICSICWKQL